MPESWFPDFSDKLRESLRSYYPYQSAEADPTFGHPADQFVNSVLSAARPHRSKLFLEQFHSTKQELRAEQADLLKSLEGAHKKLRKLSRDLDNLLGFDADPLGCADTIQELMVKSHFCWKICDGMRLLDWMPFVP